MSEVWNYGDSARNSHPEVVCTVVSGSILALQGQVWGLHSIGTLASLAAASILVAFKLLLSVLGYNRRIVVAAANFIGVVCAAIETLGRCNVLFEIGDCRSDVRFEIFIENSLARIIQLFGQRLQIGGFARRGPINTEAGTLSQH